MSTQSLEDRMKAFKKMAFPALKKKYAEVVGVAARSTNRATLLAKIEEALQEREAPAPEPEPEPASAVVSPVEPPAPPRSGHLRPGSAVRKVLPLILAPEAVQAMDAALRGKGYPTRMAFLRAAIGRQLREIGATQAAELFT